MWDLIRAHAGLCGLRGYVRLIWLSTVNTSPLPLLNPFLTELLRLKALITNFFLSFIPQSGVLRQPNVTHTRTSKNPTKTQNHSDPGASLGLLCTFLDKLESFQFIFNSNRFGRVTFVNSSSQDSLPFFAGRNTLPNNHAISIIA